MDRRQQQNAAGVVAGFDGFRIVTVCPPVEKAPGTRPQVVEPLPTG